MKKEDYINSALETLFIRAAATYAEHIGVEKLPEGEFQNVFGRKVSFHAHQHPAEVQGIAASGVRTAAFVSGRSLPAYERALNQMVRMQIPAVLATELSANYPISNLIGSGTDVLFGNDAHAFRDLLILAPVFAEKIMKPVVVVFTGQSVEEPHSTDRRLLAEFFGDPDGWTDPVGFGQELVLGKKRKRLQPWINADLPAALGVDKNEFYQGLEKASREEYFGASGQHFEESCESFKSVFSRDIQATTTFGDNKPNHLIFSTSGVADDDLEKWLKKKDIQLVVAHHLAGLRQTDFHGVSSVTVVERATENTGWLLKEVALVTRNAKVNLLHGKHVGPLEVKDWKLVGEHITDKHRASEFWIDVPFTRGKSNFPKHEVLLQKLSSKEDLPLSLQHGLSHKLGDRPEPVIPHLKAYLDKGPAFSRLSRFFDDTACFYDFPEEETVADPFQALPLSPPATAHFMNLDAVRKQYPVFHPEKCEAIDELMTSCPYGALPGTMVTVKEVITNAVKTANKKGGQIGQITPHLSALVANLGQAVVREKELGFAEALNQAFGTLAQEKSLDGEKKEALEHEVKVILDTIGDVPFSFPQQDFIEQEKRTPGSGEMFTVAVDPSACNGCGACALNEACGISMEKSTAKTTRELIDKFSLFEGLPDTSGPTITRLAEDKNFDSFAALLLSRHYYTAFTGGANTLDHQNERTVVRMVSAVAEQSFQPRMVGLLAQLDKLQNELTEKVRAVMNEALPVNHVENLISTLQSENVEQVSFDQLIGDWSQFEHFKSVNSAALKRKLELVQAIREWKWSIKEGLTGAGKARYQMVLDGSLKDLIPYPWNNFTVPVIVSPEGESLTMAQGVFTGQLRHGLDQVRLLRRATLEATNKYDPDIHDTQIANLSWEDLNDEEKAIVPPVLILAKSGAMAHSNADQIGSLLDTNTPLKLILLDDAAPNVDQPVSDLELRNKWPWMMLGSEVFLAQSSTSAPDNLLQSLRKSLYNFTPSVVTVLCPSVSEHNVDTKFGGSLAPLAIQARAFNLWQYVPGEVDQELNLKIDTTALHSPHQDWVEVSLSTGEEEKIYQPTWADWAFSLSRWQKEFTALDTGENQVVLAEYLKLTSADRANKVPVIWRIGNDGQIKVYAVSEKVVNATEAVLRNFRVLRELAGLVSEFPQKLVRQVEKELAVIYENEKTELIANHNEEKQQWEQEHLLEIKEKVKRNLMHMASMKK